LNRFEGPSHTNMMHKAMFGGLYVFFWLLIEIIFSH
jgi:hypothetical protein